MGLSRRQVHAFVITDIFFQRDSQSQNWREVREKYLPDNLADIKLYHRSICRKDLNSTENVYRILQNLLDRYNNVETTVSGGFHTEQKNISVNKLFQIPKRFM